MPPDINILLNHIKTLERKIKYLEQHHQGCILNAPSSPPTDEDSNDALVGPSLEIIPYKPQHTASKLPKSNQKYPKWRRAADRLLENVRSVTEWTTLMQQRKSSEINGNSLVIADICGVPAQARASIYERQVTDPLQDDGVIASAQAYARATKAFQSNASFVLKLQTFRELMFVSLCAVLEGCGYPIEKINETMRIYVSDSEDTNLKRLRRGAVWANHRIVELDTVLEGNATEWFLDNGVSISQYSLLAANSSNSTPYITGPFLTRKDRQLRFNCSPGSQEGIGAQEESNWTPSFIPAYIKVLVGDGLSLKQICDTLGYGPEYNTEITIKLCCRYINLRDCASAVRKRKENHDSASTKSPVRISNSPVAKRIRQYGRPVPLQEMQESVSQGRFPEELSLSRTGEAEVGLNNGMSF